MMPELVFDRDSKRGAEPPGPIQIFLSQELVCIGKVSAVVCCCYLTHAHCTGG